MLHWSTWWSHSTRDSESSSAPSPSDPEPWDHENAVRLQTRFWEQWLDAQRSWWTMYSGVLPTMARAAAGAAKPRRACQGQAAGRCRAGQETHRRPPNAGGRWRAGRWPPS